MQSHALCMCCVFFVGKPNVWYFVSELQSSGSTVRGWLEVFPGIKLYVHGAIFLRGHKLFLFLRDFYSADNSFQFRVLVY